MAAGVGVGASKPRKTFGQWLAEAQHVHDVFVTFWRGGSPYAVGVRALHSDWRISSLASFGMQPRQYGPLLNVPPADVLAGRGLGTARTHRAGSPEAESLVFSVPPALDS